MNSMSAQRPTNGFPFLCHSTFTNSKRQELWIVLCNQGQHMVSSCPLRMGDAGPFPHGSMLLLLMPQGAKAIRPCPFHPSGSHMLDLSSKENMIRFDISFRQIFKVAFVGIIIHLSACAQVLNEQSRDLYPGKANNLNHFSSGNCTDPSQEAGTTVKLWAMGLCMPQESTKVKKQIPHPEPYGQTTRFT